jgi:hypothetical protein
MKQKFKIGDIVVLKDGSSPMTIINDKLGDDPDSGYVFDGNIDVPGLTRLMSIERFIRNMS